MYDARVISITDEPIFTVILYEPESRVDMNEWILSQVAADIPTEPLKVGRPVEQCNVSYVSSACDVFIRRPELASTQLVESLVSLLVIRYFLIFLLSHCAWRNFFFGWLNSGSPNYGRLTDS